MSSFEHPVLHEMVHELHDEEVARRQRYTAQLPANENPLRAHLAGFLRRAADRIEPACSAPPTSAPQAH
jgi:hypothetical protein